MTYVTVLAVAILAAVAMLCAATVMAEAEPGRLCWVSTATTMEPTPVVAECGEGR